MTPRYLQPMGVRHAVAEDVPDVARVQTSSWEAAYRGLIPDSIFERVTVEQREQMWANYMANQPPRSALLVAEAEGDIVGMANVGTSRDDDHDGSVAELFAIYVDPAHRNGGYGRELMVAALEEVRSNGFESATLWVLDTNERGRSFYELGGWVADGTVKIDESFGDPLREVRYRKHL